MERVNPNLWTRFRKVRDVVGLSLTSDMIPGVNREIETFNWDGADAGIHDHKGLISGTLNGIRLDFSIKGVTVDDQSKVEINSQGKWVINTYRETNITIDGNFISKDGREGAMEIAIKNGRPQHEAYWLECFDGYLRLEQVVGPLGNVYEAERLSVCAHDQRRVQIPDTNHLIERQKPKTLEGA